MIKEGIWHPVGCKNKFNLHPTGLGGVNCFGLNWHRYSLIRGPKWTKPGLIVTIYSVNIHAQKIFGLPHHNSKIWHFEILPQTPSFSWFRLPFFVAVKVTPIKKVHKIDLPKSTTHYSMNMFSDTPTPWYCQGCHLAVFSVATAQKWAKMAKIEYLKNLL